MLLLDKHCNLRKAMTHDVVRCLNNHRLFWQRTAPFVIAFCKLLCLSNHYCRTSGGNCKSSTEYEESISERQLSIAGYTLTKHERENIVVARNK